MKRARKLAAAALVAGTVLAGTPVATASHKEAPAAIIFDKTYAGGTEFTGFAAGSIEGGLTSTWLNPTTLGAHGALPVQFLWEIDGYFGHWEAELRGTLDQATGAVTMRGVVDEGPHAGCRVEEQGQLVDPATFRFVGMITIDTTSC